MNQFKLYCCFSIFFLINILSYVDRMLLPAFGTQISADLGLSRQEFGFLTGFAFVTVYALCGPVMGALADRFNPARVLTVGIAVWSVMTALTGKAQSFVSILIPRLFIGAGEATLHPAAIGVFNRLFSPARRATVLSLFILGGHIGVGLSYWIAGTFGESVGWQTLFITLGVTGLLFGLVLWFFVGPEIDSRSLKGDAAVRAQPQLGDIFLTMLRALRGSPRLRVAIIGFSLVHMLYASNQFMQIWLATERGFGEFEASTLFGSAYLLVAIPSGLLGGFVTDWFTNRFATTKALFLCGVYLLTSPALFMLRLADPESILFDLGLYGAIFLLTFPYGALLACVLDEAPLEIQSTSTGFTMFSCNVLVIGGGTWFIGAAADWLTTQSSSAPLTTSLLVGDAITLCSVGCFAWLHWDATKRPTFDPQKDAS